MTRSGPYGPNDGKTIKINGIEYYIIGTTRIKITEHFPTSGKQIDELISDLIIHKIREKAGKPA